MTDNYRGGYKKAILDIRDFLEVECILDSNIRSKKQYKAFVLSLLNTLLTDPYSLEAFMEYTNNAWFKASKENKILEISRCKHLED